MTVAPPIAPEAARAAVAELRTTLEGIVDDSSLARAQYSTDASSYRAVPRIVVLDFSHFLNRILSIDTRTRTARVEPGVVLGDLQAAAAPLGLRFGPDPSTATRCTIGG